jgi:FKBP-type peptidyl-prolyl cis-trans isomerase (trigger factor)
MMLMDYVASGSRSMLDRAVVNRLVEENPFPMARSIVRSTLDEVADGLKLEGEVRERFIDEHFAEAEHDFRWVRLRNEVAKSEGIQISDDELDLQIGRVTELVGPEADKIRGQYKDREFRERLRGRLFEGRVVDFLAQNAQIEKRIMSFREFIKSTHSD